MVHVRIGYRRYDLGRPDTNSRDIDMLLVKTRARFWSGLQFSWLSDTGGLWRTVAERTAGDPLLLPQPARQQQTKRGADSNPQHQRHRRAIERQPDGCGHENGDNGRDG